MPEPPPLIKASNLAIIRSKPLDLNLLLSPQKAGDTFRLTENNILVE
jgi:hypothetical protein